MNRFKLKKTGKFIGKRLLFLLPQLIGVTVVVFLLVRMIPGNPAYLLLGQGASDEAVAALSERMGLNEPIWRQYLIFIGDLLKGDMGTSWFTSNPVVDLNPIYRA